MVEIVAATATLITARFDFVSAVVVSVTGAQPLSDHCSQLSAANLDNSAPCCHPVVPVLDSNIDRPIRAVMSDVLGEHYEFGDYGDYVYERGIVVPAQPITGLIVISSILVVVGFYASSVAFVLGCMGLLGTIAFVGICWSQRVELTSDELRIAGGSVALADLDPSFGVRPAAAVFTEPTIDLRASIQPGDRAGGDIKRFTGGYMSGVGQTSERSVVLNRRTGTLLVIEADEHEELMVYLRELLKLHGSADENVNASFVQLADGDAFRDDYEPSLIEQIKLDLLYPMAFIVALLFVVGALAAVVLL